MSLKVSNFLSRFFVKGFRNSSTKNLILIAKNPFKTKDMLDNIPYDSYYYFTDGTNDYLLDDDMYNASKIYKKIDGKYQDTGYTIPKPYDNVETDTYKDYSRANAKFQGGYIYTLWKRNVNGKYVYIVLKTDLSNGTSTTITEYNSNNGSDYDIREGVWVIGNKTYFFLDHASSDYPYMLYKVTGTTSVSDQSLSTPGGQRGAYKLFLMNDNEFIYLYYNKLYKLGYNGSSYTQIGSTLPVIISSSWTSISYFNNGDGFFYTYTSNSGVYDFTCYRLSHTDYSITMIKRITNFDSHGYADFDFFIDKDDNICITVRDKTLNVSKIYTIVDDSDVDVPYYVGVEPY